MLIGMIFVSLIAAVLALTMAEFKTNYGLEYTENESLAVISKLDKLNSSAMEYKDEIQKQKDSSNPLDILGSIFDTGYQAMKTVGNSFDVLNTMVNAGFDRMNMGSAAPLIKTAILSALLVLIFVGIILSVVVRKDV